MREADRILSGIDRLQHTLQAEIAEDGVVSIAIAVDAHKSIRWHDGVDATFKVYDRLRHKLQAFKVVEPAVIRHWRDVDVSSTRGRVENLKVILETVG